MARRLSGQEVAPEESEEEAVEEEQQAEEPGDPEPPPGPPITASDAAFVEVLENGLNLGRVEPELRTNKKLVLAAVSRCGEALFFAPDRWRRDREVVLAAAGKEIRSLRYATPDFLDNREAMLEVVRRFPPALHFASEALRGDVELARVASEALWWTLQYATLAVRSDREFMLQAVRNDGRLLRFAPEALRADERIVMAAVKRYGLALEFASDGLRGDYETCLAAVTRTGCALQFAHPSFRDDHRMVIDAVCDDPAAFRYASYRLHRDPEALAVQGLDEGSSARKPMNPQAPAPEVLESENGWVEYRRPRAPAWPVVLCAAHSGQLKPREIPNRTSGHLDTDHETDILSEEVWNEFGKGRVAAPALVRVKIHCCKLDANLPQRASCEKGCSPARAAWEAYHGWIAEACRACVEHFGFCLVFDLHGQFHRRLVTELGYLVDVDELLLMDGTLDRSTVPTALDALLRPDGPGAAERPGGLSGLVRGEHSLGAYLEKRGLKCTPSPRQPRPVESIPLHFARMAENDPAAFGKTDAKPPDPRSVAFCSGGYTARRYGAAATVGPDDSPLSEVDCLTWAKHVAVMQLGTSWLGVRDGILERRSFGEHLAWATENLLRDWMGWVMAADDRG